MRDLLRDLAVLGRALAVMTLAIFAAGAAEEVRTGYSFGTGSVDVTPQGPIRLSGYAVRKTETETVNQRLFAKALALTSAGSQPAVIVAVDNCGVPKHVRDRVAANLTRKKGLPNERFAICSTHTHSAPLLAGGIPNMFGEPVPDEQMERVQRYTDGLAEKIEQAALQALEGLKPGQLYWGQGSANFAANRRTKGGPIDHDLPILVAKDAAGKVKAVLANYACHCTTVGGDFNQVHGDWAGVAREAIQRNNPEAVALVAIGCGADSNPDPRGLLDQARQHGEDVAREVQRLLAGELKPLIGALECRAKEIELPFEPLPTREQWEERAKQPGIVGYHAQQQLKKLAAGQKLPETLPYLISAWNFGPQLAMVFLPGEVVVDYSLRLKKELDGRRLWMNAYANDVPCYIPSERILREGGYEAESSLWYYDRPARLAPATEGMIIATVKELVPRAFATPLDGPRAKP